MNNKLIRIVAGVFILASVAATTLAYQGFASANQPYEQTVNFQRGLNYAASENAKIDRLVEAMIQNPSYHVTVIGHTSQGGNPTANQDLSLRRAQEIARHFIENGIDADRVVVEGRGEEDPLPKRAGEGRRDYENRLSRVEIRIEWRG